MKRSLAGKRTPACCSVPALLGYEAKSVRQWHSPITSTPPSLWKQWPISKGTRAWWSMTEARPDEPGSEIESTEWPDQAGFAVDRIGQPFPSQLWQNRKQQSAFRHRPSLLWEQRTSAKARTTRVPPPPLLLPPLFLRIQFSTEKQPQEAFVRQRFFRPLDIQNG